MIYLAIKNFTNIRKKWECYKASFIKRKKSFVIKAYQKIRTISEDVELIK